MKRPDLPDNVKKIIGGYFKSNRKLWAIHSLERDDLAQEVRVKFWETDLTGKGEGYQVQVAKNFLTDWVRKLRAAGPPIEQRFADFLNENKAAPGKLLYALDRKDWARLGIRRKLINKPSRIEVFLDRKHPRKNRKCWALGQWFMEDLTQNLEAPKILTSILVGGNRVPKVNISKNLMTAIECLGYAETQSPAYLIEWLMGEALFKHLTEIHDHAKAKYEKGEIKQETMQGLINFVLPLMDLVTEAKQYDPIVRRWDKALTAKESELGRPLTVEERNAVIDGLTAD
jgi:hypothetical protein